MKARHLLFSLVLGAPLATGGCFISGDDDDDDVVVGGDCETKCDEAHTDCTVACDDDACVADCDTTRDDCKVECD